MKTNTAVSKESLLSTVKPSKAIIKLAIPATLALLAKAVYNIVDTAYIGMLHSDLALAAVIKAPKMEETVNGNKGKNKLPSKNTI